MANDPREMRSPAPIVLAWGVPSERENFLSDAALWLTGGVTLLLWTGLAFLLTSA